ncbi:MAG: hypothetical protein QW158_07595 [Nitrososphaerales archaeon]
MQLDSPLGEMDITFEKCSIEEGCLIIVGKVGVWDSIIRVEKNEIRELFKFFLDRKILWYLLSALLKSK